MATRYYIALKANGTNNWNKEMWAWTIFKTDQWRVHFGNALADSDKAVTELSKLW